MFALPFGLVRPVSERNKIRQILDSFSTDSRRQVLDGFGESHQGTFRNSNRTGISLCLVNVIFVTQQVISAFEFSAAEGTLVPGQLSAAFAKMSGQGVGPCVTFPALVTGKRSVVVDAIQVPLRV